MHDFVSHILRQYFHATHWNEYNSYLHLTSSSSSILDFAVPTGLSLSISASPTPPFFTTYRLGALPNLRAGIGYIYASTQEPVDFGKSSKDVRLKEVIERFRIVEASPRRNAPARGQKYWLAGERYFEPITEPQGTEGGEYLVYGCMHVPSARLDALWTKRMSPTWQLIVTAVSTPPKYPLNALQSAALATQSSFASGSMGKAAGLSGSVDRLDSSTHTLSSSGTMSGSTPQQSTTAAAAAAQDSYGLGPPGSTNLQLTLQRDTGRWFTEYSYSIDDALWGFRVLHNFGATGDHSASMANSDSTTTNSASTADGTRTQIGTTSGLTATTSVSSSGTDDADAGGGLRGRFSAGAEVFVSTVEKSAGLSTGIRFSTLPDSPGQPIIAPFEASIPPSTPEVATATPSQPPTVITATLNPMMGHLSTAYAARMARDVVVASRFDFNVYSYESEWTVGAEYWLRKRGGEVGAQTKGVGGIAEERVVKREREEAGPMSLREQGSGGVLDGSAAPKNDAEDKWSLRTPAATPSPPSFDSTTQSSSSPASTSPSTLPPPPPASPLTTLLSPITGVLKARLSTTSDIRLLWQGRLSSCLVSLGVKADLSPASPLPSPSTRGIVKSIGLEVMYFSTADID
ncbi:Protein of unknown function DUF3722 [Kalmanozyma brasiliensis GHG001]|uniref:Protein of unknown function DUF3722 n=1 Tax=Kalmanozyma brasiliensis (strain GHG001) TaxID=1365824 RepID=UPI002867F109|nr:Protein of unknown function DUF3722 [Kalmanozyma brasiliensis GHG001]KAF6767308.1 Protein of unknown function DUF3722 [Kalmanozyma brasiliensis GHG001]